MVVDCRKVNLKICFDLYHLPTIEYSFQVFRGYCVLDFRLKLCVFSVSSHSPEPAGNRLLHPLWTMNLTSFRWGSARVVKGSVG